MEQAVCLYFTTNQLRASHSIFETDSAQDVTIQNSKLDKFYSTLVAASMHECSNRRV